jgi:hypothetical protein
MRLKPSDAKDLTSFWHSLTDINMLMTYSDEELEPHFDPLDPKLIKKVDWEELREITDVAFWDENGEWKTLISRNIANPNLTKFVNFYIYFHIDSIAQEILEGTDKTKAERNEDFSFYDLLFNYKYLDKRAKKVFKIVSPHVENSRGWFLMDDETFISLLTEVVEESKPKKKAKKQAKKTNGKDTRKSK